MNEVGATWSRPLLRPLERESKAGTTIGESTFKWKRNERDGKHRGTTGESRRRDREKKKRTEAEERTKQLNKNIWGCSSAVIKPWATTVNCVLILSTTESGKKFIRVKTVIFGGTEECLGVQGEAP